MSSQFSVVTTIQQKGGKTTSECDFLYPSLKGGFAPCRTKTIIVNLNTVLNDVIIGGGIGHSVPKVNGEKVRRGH